MGGPKSDEETRIAALRDKIKDVHGNRLPTPPPSPRVSNNLPTDTSWSIIAMGLETTTDQLKAHVGDMYALRGNDCPIDDREIGAAIRARGIYTSDNDIYIDTRLFDDPAAMRDKLVDCTGYNHHIIGRITRHKHFNSWLREVKLRIMAAVGRLPYPNLVFYCKSGKHRSVASSLIISHILVSHERTRIANHQLLSVGAGTWRR